VKISKHRISIKTLRESDKGWSKPSHQTHIGWCENFIDGWQNKLVLDGYAVIKDFGVKRISAYSKPIKRKNGDIDAPSFKTNPFDDLEPGKYNSLLKVAREASQTLRNEWNTLNILMIVCFNENNEIIVILLEFENNILTNIKNHTNLVNKNNEISAKVLDKNHASFNYIRSFAQFYLDQISTGFTEEFKNNLLEEGWFDISNIEDSRKKIYKSIAIRQGQSKFRNKLLDNYKKKCCFSNCDVTAVLEACHIYPYMGPKTNHLQNGIILRSDLHSLYDQGLIYFDEKYIIRLTERLKISEQYRYLDGQPIKNLPKNELMRPSKEAIKYKLKEVVF
jgi:hypothetical protein